MEQIVPDPELDKDEIPGEFDGQPTFTTIKDAMKWSKKNQRVARPPQVAKIERIVLREERIAERQRILERDKRELVKELEKVKRHLWPAERRFLNKYVTDNKRAENGKPNPTPDISEAMERMKKSAKEKMMKSWDNEHLIDPKVYDDEGKQ